MRLLFLAFLSLGVMACGDDGDDEPESPFARVPITEELTDDSLTGKVELVRDTYGVAHIYATNADDASFAQGFVMAHDRLAQMDTLRRFGSGTLSEQLGGLDPSLIDTDIQMRVHRMRPLAEESLAMMKASGDPTDAAVVRAMERFADGVNTFVEQLNTSDRWSMDSQITATFDPQTFVPWSPVDSLVLGRFQAFSLSFTVQTEATLTEMYQKLRAVYDAGGGQPVEIQDRRAIAADLMRIAPVGRTSTIDGFPNVTTDSGTRADAGRPSRSRGKKAARKGTSAAATATTSARPEVPAELFDQLRTMFPADFNTGAFGGMGPQAFMAPRSGSNHWTISPQKAGGKTLLATDQHLQLSNPSIFYPIHIVIDGDPKNGGEEVEALGVTFPGIPGIILGTNGVLAWSGTVAYHDVNDLYMEQVAPCGDRSCVTFNNTQVPIETWTETIKVGIKGQILSERQVTYERVPHHGPILPTIRDGAIVPRTGNSALSIKYTGYQPSFEIRAVWDLMRARTVDEGFTALRNFSFGGQNWGMIDNSGNIGWTSTVKIPQRVAAATSWHPTSNPTGNAPWFILPGDGSAEWDGFMDTRYVPHVINPIKGYIATANNDTTGATFDNNALNQPAVNGRPLYAGMAHSAGLRVERIAAELEAAMARGPLTLDDLAKLQHDSSSTVGKKLTPVIRTALAFVENPGSAPADVDNYLDSLNTDQKNRLIAARALLGEWSFGTPAAVGGAPTAAEQKDSASTALFNTWMHFFIKETLDDELTRATVARTSLDDNLLVRVVHGMLLEPGTMKLSTQTSQPILCDRFSVTGPHDSCTRMIISSMMLALDALAAPASADNPVGFGSADPMTWKWGAKHRLLVKPLVPNPALLIPAPGEGGAELAGGFPRAGDTFVINRTDAGWQDLDFSQSTDGAAQRFLVEAENGKKMKVKWQLPGGTIYDSRSPHYRDLLDKYYLKQIHFDVPFEISEIAAAGEERWTFK